MLRARAKAADEERNDQSNDAATQSGENITETCQRRAESENSGGTETLGQKSRRNLKAGERAGKHRPHQPQRGESRDRIPPCQIGSIT